MEAIATAFDHMQVETSRGGTWTARIGDGAKSVASETSFRPVAMMGCLGVLIITREVLDTALGRTLAQPDADAIFREGEQSIADALSKHKTAPQLPGI